MNPSMIHVIKLYEVETDFHEREVVSKYYEWILLNHFETIVKFERHVKLQEDYFEFSCQPHSHTFSRTESRLY